MKQKSFDKLEYGFMELKKDRVLTKHFEAYK